MDASQRLPYLFRRYFAKEHTEAEKNELFQLLLQSEHDDTLRQLIDETWNHNFPSYPQDNRSADAILRHIVAQRESGSPPAEDHDQEDMQPLQLQSSPPLPRRSKYVALARWAAILIPAAALIGLLTRYNHHPGQKQAPPAPIVQGTKPPPERCLTLSDGSTVLLNRDAQIDYQKGFTPSTREVTLHGEAFFAIHHDARPFIVHTGTVRTIVLGTAFNIDAQNENQITITVTKGKVKVENARGQFRIVRGNEQLRLDSINTRMQMLPVNAGEVLVWKKPYLIFNDVTMKEAMTELEARFHVSIVFTNPAAENCPVTASFTEGESLEAIVKVLSKINNMEYSIDHSHVLISGEGCK